MALSVHVTVVAVEPLTVHAAPPTVKVSPDPSNPVPVTVTTALFPPETNIKGKGNRYKYDKLRARDSRGCRGAHGARCPANGPGLA